MLFLVLLIAIAASIHFQPPKGVAPSVHFQSYMAYFNKSYSTQEAKTHAFSNYLRSIKRVHKKQSISSIENSGAVFGLTKFADMSPKEFKATILMKTLKVHTPSEKRAELQSPSGAIDWVQKGMTTPVKNQLQCGSCWTFSAAETIESANLIAGKISTSDWLAPQEIVDCDNGGNGCGGGWPSQAMNWVISQGGLDTEASYPYTAQQGQCSQGTIGATISSVGGPIGDEGSMYNQLQSSPLSICCDASAWQDYSGGVLAANQCGQNIDHAIQLTGYSPDQGGYWIVRNSWGADWGNSGFIWLQYGGDTCGITSNVYYATA